MKTAVFAALLLGAFITPPAAAQAPAAGGALMAADSTPVTIRLALAGRPLTRSYVLRNPDRVVVDLRAALPPGQRIIAVQQRGVRRVRLWQVNDTLARIVADLDRPLNHVVTADAQSVMLLFGQGREISAAVTRLRAAPLRTSASFPGADRHAMPDDRTLSAWGAREVLRAGGRAMVAANVVSRPAAMPLDAGRAGAAGGEQRLADARTALERAPAAAYASPARPQSFGTSLSPLARQLAYGRAAEAATVQAVQAAQAAVDAEIEAAADTGERNPAPRPAPAPTTSSQVNSLTPPAPAYRAVTDDALRNRDARRGQGLALPAPVKPLQVAKVPKPPAPLPDMVVAQADTTRSIPPKADTLMSVTFDDVDIRAAIQTFADFSGKSIVAGGAVQGKVSAKIDRKPWRSAMSEILYANGFSVEDGQDGILRVDATRAIYERSRFENPITRVVRVNYPKATSLVVPIRAVLSRDCGNPAPAVTAGGAVATAAVGGVVQTCTTRGDVQADDASNSLILSEVPSQMDALVDYVKQLDRKIPLVNIRARLLFVNRTGLQELGITYDLGGPGQYSNRLVQRPDPTSLRPIDTNGDGINDQTIAGANQLPGTQVIGLSGTSFSGLANSNARITSPALELIVGTMAGGYRLTSFIDAVQTAEFGDTQAEPNITVLSNRTAKILVGDEIPVRVIDAGGAAGAGGAGGAGGGARATVSFREAGIVLEVTPSVTESGDILMKVHAENSSASVSSADVGVIISKQSADAEMLARNGQTIAMGGLTVTTHSGSTTGVPLLMDLPLIGRLFRTERKNQSKRDLVILVTPEIVPDMDTPPVAPPASVLSRQP